MKMFLVRDQEVGGSNPLAPTILFNDMQGVDRLVFRPHVGEIVGGGIPEGPNVAA